MQLHVIEVLVPELLSVCEGRGRGKEEEEEEERCPTEQFLAPAFALLAGATK